MVLTALRTPRRVLVPGANQFSKTSLPVSLLEFLSREQNANPNSLQLVLCGDGKHFLADCPVLDVVLEGVWSPSNPPP